MKVPHTSWSLFYHAVVKTPGTDVEVFSGIYGVTALSRPAIYVQQRTLCKVREA
jgi:hypothetical protein